MYLSLCNLQKALEVVSKPRVVFEDKTQAESKAQHMQVEIHFLKV